MYIDIPKAASTYSPAIDKVNLVINTLSIIINDFTTEVYESLPKPDTDYESTIFSPWDKNYFPWIITSFPWLIKSKQTPTYSNIEKPQ